MVGSAERGQGQGPAPRRPEDSARRQASRGRPGRPNHWNPLSKEYRHEQPVAAGLPPDGAGEWAVEDADLTTLLLLGGLRSVWRFGAKPRPAGLAERIVAALVGRIAARPEQRYDVPVGALAPLPSFPG